MCFVKQMSLCLQEIVKRYELRKLYGCNYYVHIIGIAELCSWIGVATKCQIWNAFEESIWTLTALHITICYIALYVECRRRHLEKEEELKRYCMVCTVSGLLFVTFMITVDVPMYVQRFYADNANNVEYLSLMDGIFDLMHCHQI